MAAPSPVAPPLPVITWDGVREGITGSISMMPGFTVFGIAVGALSVDKGLTLFEALAMSGLVYAGASQLMALQAWQAHWDIATVLAVALVVFVVNLRFVLMGAALQPFYAPLPRLLTYGTLATLTDGSFLVATRAQREGRNDFGIFIGSGLFLWVMWVGTTAIGYQLGHAMHDPKRFGLDMVMPIVFATHLIVLAKGKRDAVMLPVAAGASLLAAWLLDGYWFIIIGALAGSAYAVVTTGREV